MHENDSHQVTIEVRGKPKYMVLDITEYNSYREYELDRAINEAEADYVNGKYDTIKDFNSLAKKLFTDSTDN